MQINSITYLKETEMESKKRLSGLERERIQNYA